MNSTFLGAMTFAQRKVATNKPVIISGESQLDAKLNHNDDDNQHNISKDMKVCEEAKVSEVPKGKLLLSNKHNNDNSNVSESN